MFEIYASRDDQIEKRYSEGVFDSTRIIARFVVCFYFVMNDEIGYGGTFDEIDGADVKCIDNGCVC